MGRLICHSTSLLDIRETTHNVNNDAASAGALCEAERHGYTRSLLLVQEFVTDKTLDRKHDRNSMDLARFLARLSNGKYLSLTSGEIVGPIRIPGTPLVSASVDFYVGKLTRNLRAN